MHVTSLSLNKLFLFLVMFFFVYGKKSLLEKPCVFHLTSANINEN